MRILCRNNDWIAVDKPTGISTHGAWEGDLGVTEWLNLHSDERTHVVSRLDKETSGVLILALNTTASAEAERLHASGKAAKTYELIAAAPTGKIPPSEWECRDPIDGKAAHTSFRLLGPIQASVTHPSGNAQRLYHLQAQIHSGKKHQIRRHAAWSGFPILGDGAYGGPAFPRVCLHCTEVQWPGFDKWVISPAHPAMSALQSGRSLAEGATLAAADRRWGALDSITNAMRLLHRNEGRGDYAIDRFDDCLCAWLYSPADEAACREEADLLGRVFALRNGVLKKLHRDPHHKGALCETSTLFGNPAKTTQIREHDLKFTIDLAGSEQTGFFLDQRDNRRRVSQLASGKRIANLFAYTCSFTVAAARSKPEVIFSVDISRSALREGIANLQLNGLEDPLSCKFVEEDCRSWLLRQQRKHPINPFQMMICDPPTFGKTARLGQSKKSQSSIKGTAFRIADEWNSLAAAVHALLEPDGWALFCCNNQKLSTAFLEDALRGSFGEVVRYKPPLDFPDDVHSLHNRMFWCRPRARKEISATLDQ